MLLKFLVFKLYTLPNNLFYYDVFLSSFGTRILKRFCPVQTFCCHSDNVDLPTISLSLTSLCVSGKDFAYINEPFPVKAKKAFFIFPYSCIIFMNLPKLKRGIQTV
jgi:hypothetical protein